MPTKLKATRAHPMILRASELNSRLLNEIKPCQCYKPSERVALLQPQEENEKIISNTFMFFIKIISHGPFPNYSGYMARSV